ncbi:hypothetical protein J6590_060362 [Homalodisca vitripennis]|nr:hypothetical protein J6590_060362 [Homalodisca vitripennis]
MKEKPPTQWNVVIDQAPRGHEPLSHVLGVTVLTQSYGSPQGSTLGPRLFHTLSRELEIVEPTSQIRLHEAMNTFSRTRCDGTDAILRFTAGLHTRAALVPH